MEQFQQSTLQQAFLEAKTKNRFGERPAIIHGKAVMIRQIIMARAGNCMGEDGRTYVYTTNEPRTREDHELIETLPGAYK